MAKWEILRCDLATKVYPSRCPATISFLSFQLHIFHHIDTHRKTERSLGRLTELLNFIRMMLDFQLFENEILNR